MKFKVGDVVIDGKGETGTVIEIRKKIAKNHDG